MVQCDSDNGSDTIRSRGKHSPKDGIFSVGEQSTSSESLSLNSSPILSQNKDQGEPKDPNPQSDNRSEVTENGHINSEILPPNSNMFDVALALLENDALENKTANGDTKSSCKSRDAGCSKNPKVENLVRTISRQRLEYLVMRYLVRNIADQSCISELRREIQEGQKMIMTLASKIKIYCQHGRELKVRQENIDKLKTNMQLPTSEKLCRDVSTQVNPVDFQKHAAKSQDNNSPKSCSNKRRNPRPEINRLEKRSRTSSVLRNVLNGTARVPATVHPSLEQNAPTAQYTDKSPIKSPQKSFNGSSLAPAPMPSTNVALPTAKPSNFLPMNIIPSDVLMEASKKSLNSENNVSRSTETRRPDGEIVTKVATVKWPEGNNIPQGLISTTPALAVQKQMPNTDRNQNANVIDLTDDDSSNGTSDPRTSTSMRRNSSSSSSSSSGKLLKIISISPPSVGRISAKGSAVSKDSKSVQHHLSLRRHPAPLPQLQGVSDSRLPCPLFSEPVIQLSKRESNICVVLDLQDRSILSKLKDFFIYEYHAKDCPPSSDHWRCVDKVEACMPPVEIVLSNIEPDLRYYIAVVARDRLLRFGPFSLVNYIEM